MKRRVESVADIEFIDPGILVDGDLELRLIEKTPADHTRFVDDAGVEKTVQMGGVALIEVRLRSQLGG